MSTDEPQTSNPREHAYLQGVKDGKASIASNPTNKFFENVKRGAIQAGVPSEPPASRELAPNNPTDLDNEIYVAILDGLVLANDDGQPYIKYDDTAVDSIKAIIARERIAEHEWIKDNAEQFGNAGTGDIHEYRLKAEVSDTRIAQLKAEATNKETDNA